MPDSLDNNLFDQLVVEPAKTDILPLVKRFFQQNGMRAQAAKDDIVYIVRRSKSPGSPIIAALRLCPLEDSWLLRSMCVAASYQRQGIGQYFLAQIKSELSARQCYCFAYRHLESFYKNAGFNLATLTNMPATISQRFKQYAEKNNIVAMQFIDD